MLCKRLGGPLTHSPARPALRRAPSSMRPPKPGAAVERPQSRQVRRTLERVLTDEKAARRPAPALSRSATDSVLPDLKREPSDTILSNVPSKRSTFHKSNRYSQREVDLGAVSQAAEAKAKRKANVEQELQGAIAALKRPNPRMAVKEFVEAADKRAAGARSRSTRRNPSWISRWLTMRRIQASRPQSVRTRGANYGHTEREPAQRRLCSPSTKATTIICYAAGRRGRISFQLYTRPCFYC